MVLSFAFAACTASESGDKTRVPSSPGRAVVSDTVTRLVPDGFGSLRIGMTRAEVVTAMGADANPDAVGGPDPEQCDEFRPARAPTGMLVMIEQGRLTRISLGAGVTVRSDRGLGIGDSASAIRTAYGASAQSAPHKYLDAPAEYITVWSVAPPNPAARGMLYDIGTDGRVAHVRAGGSAIQYVEGCL